MAVICYPISGCFKALQVNIRQFVQLMMRYCHSSLWAGDSNLDSLLVRPKVSKFSHDVQTTQPGNSHHNLELK